MIAKKRRRPPAYSLHKPSGQARVRIKGKDHYLGPYDSPESHERYDDLIAAWRIKNSVNDEYTLTVDDLAIAFLEHAKQHYRKHGRETSEVHCVRSVLRYLVAVAGPTRAREFGPRLLKAVRQRMVDDGLCRGSVNSNISRVRRVFRWAVAEELIPATVLVALQAVQGLKPGRGGAVESAPVRPVPQHAIDAVEPYVSRPVWTMIQLQLLTGMRSGEVTIMRACDLNTSGEIWEYTPHTHKMEHHHRERVVFLGPQAQSIVRPFLTADLQAYLFVPREARRVCGEVGDVYSRDAYRRAITRACEQAFGMPRELRNPNRGLKKLPEADRTGEYQRRLKAACQWREEHCWHPHQLRHTAATRIRREAGIETARCVLGHSELSTTEIYAEADLARARDVMGKVG